jgi:cobalt/nickel transport system permease protein
MYSKAAKKIIALTTVFTGMLLASMPTGAMHIMEGFLPPLWAILWTLASMPFLVAGYFSIRKKVLLSQKHLVLLAMCGAFAFVLSSLKIPSITGSCSHPTGVGLGAILFGPASMSVIGVIILLFQAFFLAHGGLTTLGANTFSMGIAGPVISFLVYRGLKKLKVHHGFSIFLAVFAGNMMTYIVTSVQLALAHPSGGDVMISLVKFLSIFALTQIPLAVSEGLVTVVVFNVIEKYNGETLKSLKMNA